MNLGELFVQIGAIGNSKEVKAFGEAVKKAGQTIDNYDKKLKKGQNSGDKLTGSIKGTIGAIVGIAGAVAGAYYALDRLTDSLAKQNLQWLNFTRQTDMALSTFQKWGTIGKIVGVDNAAQQLENLNQKIFNLRLTGEGAKGFQMAGIMPTNAEDVLEQLRTRISGMNNTAATYLLEQMGLDPKMITLLRMGREEWEQYLEVQRKYTLNENQRKNIDKMNRQLQVARVKLQYLKDRILLKLMPIIVKIGQSIARVTEALARFGNWISKLISSMPVLLKGLIAIGAALWALAAHPLLAALTALYLLIDDFMVYKQGGKSVIGLIMQEVDNIRNGLDFDTPKWIKALAHIVDNVDKLIHWAELMKQSENIDKNRGVSNLKSIEDVLKSVEGKKLSPKQQEAVEHLKKLQKLENSLDTKGDIESVAKPNYIIDHLITPAAKQIIHNANKNITFNMPTTINTNQPAKDINNELIFLLGQFAWR